jgi:hypothetical protein
MGEGSSLGEEHGAHLKGRLFVDDDEYHGFGAGQRSIIILICRKKV